MKGKMVVALMVCGQKANTGLCVLPDLYKIGAK